MNAYFFYVTNKVNADPLEVDTSSWGSPVNLTHFKL